MTMLTTNDAVGMADANAVLLREIPYGDPGRSPLANCANVGVGQLREIARSALGVAVATVVGGGSKKQVGGVNARRVITPMKDVQAINDRTPVQLPAQAGGPHGTSVSIHATTDRQATVSEPVSCARPLPAVVRLTNGHLFPKPLFHWTTLAWPWHEINLTRTAAPREAQ